ncbi:TonB-dependent receptor; Outer membrane receptor for ferrienterochelin and colicins [plant metagenome]|uniref:TonB-dependent receptor Outer membrane receptor for ferrienterochelin and colicins n=1 Tax=plant metagenome TaxID=1297885 RepID=A0A484RBV4_9ZZZZ
MTPSFKLTRLASALLLASAATSIHAAQADTNEGDARAVGALDTVFVTASSVATDIRDAPASVNVITREELDKKPVSSIAEVLGTLPGVTGGYSATGAGSKVAFRGMPDKYTLILIDGKRVGSSSLLGHRSDTIPQDLNWLSTESIERIEVVRGAMSTLYGSEAMGGVINIITRKIAPVWGGSLTTSLKKPDSGSSGDTFQNGFSISGPLTEKLGLRLGGSYNKRDSDTAVNGSTGSKDRSVNARLAWQLAADHSLTFDALSSQERALPFPDEANRPADATNELFGSLKMTHQSFGLGYEGKFGEARTKLDLYVNTYKNEAGADSPLDGAKSKESVADFKVDLPVTLGVDQWLTAGIQYKREEVSNPSNIGNIASFISPDSGQVLAAEKDPEGWAWSAFLEDQIFLRDNLTLTLGARGDKTDGYDFQVSPRAYMVYHPADAWTIRGGVSKGFRAPNLKERSLTSGTTSMGMGCTSLRPFGYTGGTCFMVGNPDLEPEVSTNYELGVAYDQAGYQASVTYFQSSIKNMIQNGFLGNINGVWYTQQYNIEKGETAGLEGSFGVPLSRDLQLTGNTTYMIESKNKTTGERLNMVPEWTANATLNWKATEKLSTYVSAQYLGKQLYRAPDTAQNSFAEANTTFDVGVNYAANKNLTLRAGILNFTNNAIKTDDDYGDGDPRTFYVGLTARF